MTPLNPAQRRIHQAAMRLFAERGATQLNISDLAQEAGVARGTVYNHVKTVEQLFAEVASQLCEEMHLRIAKGAVGIEDPAQRLANGMRCFIRRAHDEPQWAAFLNRFAPGNVLLRQMFYGQALDDVCQGLCARRYRVQQEQLASVISLIAGATLGAMFMVADGLKTWREAGSETAELVLRALGIAEWEARQLATAELPPLPELD